MPRRLTNNLLLTLLLCQALTGLFGWIWPEPAALPLYDLHRALGVALVLVLLVWKQQIVRRSLRRRLRPPWDRSVLAGLVSGTLLLASVSIGLLWTLGLVSYEALWGYSPLNLHVFIGLTVLGCLVPHLLRRWEGTPDRRTLAARRSVLRLVGLSGAALLGWRLIEGAAGASRTGERRPSGSNHAGSFSGNDFPVTIWLFDDTQYLDTATWMLRLEGRLSHPTLLSYDDLARRPTRETRAVLDCTSGWWSEQIWSGASLADLLTEGGVDPAAREVLVTSVTGHHWRFPLDDLRGALLGTHVGGEPLSAEHGGPVRLVAPERRGFQWVKWLARVEVI